MWERNIDYKRCLSFDGNLLWLLGSRLNKKPEDVVQEATPLREVDQQAAILTVASWMIYQYLGTGFLGKMLLDFIPDLPGSLTHTLKKLQVGRGGLIH